MSGARRTALQATELARAWSGGELNALTRAADAHRAAGKSIFDLTEGNPTRCGIAFPAQKLAAIAADAISKACAHNPDPLGAPAARDAMVAWYARRGMAADPARVMLAPGTSMAYFYAFRLLAEPGETVLAPSPGYPLFDELAAIADIELNRYAMARSETGWSFDAPMIEAACTGGERALVVVAPHNPTGAYPDAATWREIGALCRRRNLALIVDEVFCETLAPGAAAYARPNPADFPLLLTFNGVSKMLALPQLKLGWIAFDGDAERVGPLLRAFEFMSDAFLPLPDLTQAMLPALLEAGDGSAIAAIRDEINARRALAMDLLEWPVEPCNAGNYICLRLDEGFDDDEVSLAALEREGVLVHPGHFYDLPSHLVLTCLASPEILREGIARLNRLKHAL